MYVNTSQIIYLTAAITDLSPRPTVQHTHWGRMLGAISGSAGQQQPGRDGMYDANTAGCVMLQRTACDV